MKKVNSYKLIIKKRFTNNDKDYLKGREKESGRIKQ